MNDEVSRLFYEARLRAGLSTRSGSVTPGPVAPVADGDAHWMRMAWLTSARSEEGAPLAGAIAVRFVRDGRHATPVLACSGNLSLGAIAALVAHSASNGPSLNGTRVYCWPEVASAEVGLLLEAGVRAIAVPAVLEPQRRTEEASAIRFKVAAAGAEYLYVDLEETFMPLQSALSQYQGGPL